MSNRIIIVGDLYEKALAERLGWPAEDILDTERASIEGRIYKKAFITFLAMCQIANTETMIWLWRDYVARGTHVVISGILEYDKTAD